MDWRKRNSVFVMSADAGWTAPIVLCTLQSGLLPVVLGTSAQWAVSCCTLYWCRVDCSLLICVLVQGGQISLVLLLVPIVLVQGELLIILIILCTDAEWTACYFTVYWCRVNCSLLYSVLVQGGLPPYCAVYWCRVDCSLLYCVLVQGGLLPDVPDRSAAGREAGS